MKAKKADKGLQGRRFTQEQKQHALTLIVSGVDREKVAATVGTTTQSLRRWVEVATAAGTMPVVPKARKPSKAAPRPTAAKPAKAVGAGAVTKPRSPYAPADPAEGLSEPEVAAILEYKRKHLSMGPAQLRAQLKRFHGWRISLKAIARVLRGHGYEPVHRGSRPKGEVVRRFEVPRRNALWQMDFAAVRVGEERLHALIVLDDFSRYVVAHALSSSPSSAVATATFRSARHGKPEAA